MSDGQQEYIPFTDRRLGRHIRHDPRSRQFAAPRRAVPQTDVRHRNHGRKLDQGSVGACTGFTGAHCMNVGPYRRRRRPLRTARHADALDFYSRATQLDPWPGIYPPADTGSSGLAVCQAMQEAGWIVGYEWGFGFAHGLETIPTAPWMQGTWWTYDMFTPDSSGRVRPTGGDAGGHEYLWVGVDVERARSWFLNSWGPGWGERGYFYMSWDDHAALLARDGDLVRPI